MRSNAVIVIAVLMAFSANLWADICGHCLQETLLNGCCFNPLCSASIFSGHCTHASRISMEHDYSVTPANFRATAAEKHFGLARMNRIHSAGNNKENRSEASTKKQYGSRRNHPSV